MDYCICLSLKCHLILDVYDGCKEFCGVHSGVILENEFKTVLYLTCNKNIKRLFMHVALTL